MNRRKLLYALGASGIAVGMGACKSDRKADSGNANSDQKSSSPKPVAKATPMDCKNTKIADQEAVDDITSILMVLMLSISQLSLHGDFACLRLSDDLFQANGSTATTSAEANARWGFHPDKNNKERFDKAINALKAGIPQAGIRPQQFLDALNIVHDVFQKASGYTGPDCPGPVGIKTIVSTAVDLAREP